ncbi:TonB-dependent receptor [Pseudoalteromonas luteoviolacea]|uniref:TonB-dependent receptor n=1 Tax=Pseudoalteromonas luteoviolacea TaxID=43657 RepID=UPI001B35E5AE|nr:TonB-dependent receptor [Pseudoalteromonas luteoviolacea]MBQ4811136.1 TonB-dependent receptor [Pseudoalteromonas luteoviolacea]
MSTFKPSLLTAALIAAGVSHSVSAQDQQTAKNKEEVEVIEVRGISRSIIASIDKKRFGDTVSEVVDAGDLASLPDISIADALSRLPGVTAVRDSGQSSQLNIRGMNGDFIQTTLNGREQASTSGYSAGSRWISFDQYPSELITQAAVYKSPKASLVEGGVAGTVELKTANPLDADKTHNFNTSVRFSHNDAASDIDADANGERLSFSYQGKFLDETLGFGIGAAYLNQPNSSVEFSGHSPEAARDIDGDGIGEERSFNGYQYRNTAGTDERLGLMSTLVYQPADNFKAQFDYFHSTFDSEDRKNGLNIEGLSRNNQAKKLFELRNAKFDGEGKNRFLVAGEYFILDPAGPWIEMRSEDQSTESTTDSFGLNLEYSTDKWEISFDLAHSEGEKTRRDMIASMHAYEFGTATLEDGTVVETWQELRNQYFSFDHNSTDASSLVLGHDYTDLSHMRLGDWEQFPHKYTDKIDSANLDFKYHIEHDIISSVEVGVRWSKREFTDQRSTFRWGAREGQNGYRLPNGEIVTNKNCEFNHQNHACVPHDLTGFVTVKNGGGINYLDLDMVGIADAVFGAGNYDGQQTWEHNWTLVESGAVKEEVYAAYVMANIDTEIGNIPVSGNLGVRAVRTDTKSIGIQQIQGDEVGDAITDDNGVTRTDYRHVNYGPEYTDILPSLNLNFRITEQDQIRFAAAKVMGRPPVNQLRGGAGSWADTANDGVSQRYNVWSKGNPNLDPFRANQMDLSYEHYFEDGGAFVAALFWKNIESLIEDVTYFEGEIDWSSIGLEVPEGFVPGQYQTTRNNDKGGYVRGIELAYTTLFDNLPGVFSGLGLNANYSYTESETTIDGGGNFPDTQLSLPGLSKNVWSATLFWNIDKFTTHFNIRYRDEYTYLGATPGGTTPTSADEYTVVDWQATYDFDNGLQTVFQINNLTDEANTSNLGSSLRTGEDKVFGRQYFLGFNYSF